MSVYIELLYFLNIARTTWPAAWSKWDIMSVSDKKTHKKHTATVNNRQFPSWHLSSEWKWMGKWPALYRPSSACVTGWMMQIEDNISAMLNGITPNLMSLKGWVLALLSGGIVVWAALAWLTHRLSAVTGSTIKSSENVTCQLGGDDGMNCHSLSEPILSLIHDVPHTTVGTEESAGASDKYLFR